MHEKYKNLVSANGWAPEQGMSAVHRAQGYLTFGCIQPSAQQPWKCKSPSVRYMVVLARNGLGHQLGQEAVLTLWW